LDCRRRRRRLGLRLELHGLELHLIARRIHLVGRHNPVGHRGERHDCLFAGFRRPQRREGLVQRGGADRWGLLRGQLLVVSDAGQDVVVGLLGHLHVREVVFVGDLIVIRDDRLVDHRGRPEIVDDRRLVDIRHPDRRIRWGGVERPLGHHHRGLGKGQAPNVDADRGHTGDDHCPWPPGAVRVVDFRRREWDPANVDVAVDPGDPPRIPRKAE
jgi:hypothetical protein